MRIPARVLIVDDNRDSAEMLAELLELAGHETIIALDAEEALAIAVEYRPDVTFFDLGVDPEDGLAFARSFNEKRELRRCRLVVCTGYSDQGTRDRYIRGGFAHHLSKPIDVALLFQIVSGEVSAETLAG